MVHEVSQRPYAELVKLGISDERFSRYSYPTDGSYRDGLGRYMRNLAMSEALYPTLAMFEVVLRNRVHFSLAGMLGSEEWMRHSTVLRPIEQLKVAEALRELNRLRKTPITPGKVVASLSLGFWTGLFNQHYWSKFGGLPKAVFPRANSRLNLRLLNADLREVRLFRNRVYHYEPIWVLPTVAGEMHAIMHRLLDWMDPDWRSIVVPLDRFAEVQQPSQHYVDLIT